jgi:hypothetical protein
MTEVNQAAPARKVLTRDEKIAAYYDQSAAALSKAKALEAERDAEQALANLAAGSTVEFDLGRAETKRTLRGSIIAIGEVDGKSVAKVISGEGLATAVYQVPVAGLRLPAPEAEVVVEAEAPAGEDNIDDLLSNVSPETEAALNAVVL